MLSVVLQSKFQDKRPTFRRRALEVYSGPRLISGDYTLAQSVWRQSVCLVYYGLDRPRFHSEYEQEFFLSPKRLDRRWGPPGLQFIGCWFSFPWWKRPGCDVDHSPPCSAEVKNEYSNNFSLPIFYGTDRDNFTFTSVLGSSVMLGLMTVVCSKAVMLRLFVGLLAIFTV